MVLWSGTIRSKDVSLTERNIRLLNILPGEERSYMSFDNVSSRDQIINYEVEILNSLEPKGRAPQFPLLKIGAPIMLLRKLDSPKQCNVTILTMKCMIPHVLKAAIMSRKYAGVNCFICRKPMRPNDLIFEFENSTFLLDSPSPWQYTCLNVNQWKLFDRIWQTVSLHMARFMLVFQELDTL